MFLSKILWVMFLFLTKLHLTLLGEKLTLKSKVTNLNDIMMKQ